MAITDALVDIGAVMSVYDNPADLLFEKDNVARLALFWSQMDIWKRQQFAKVPDQEQLIVRKFRSQIENDMFLHNYKEFREDKPVNRMPKLRGPALVKYCGDHKLTAFQQFKCLLVRNIRQASRDKVFFYGRYVAFLFAALVVGLFFQGIGPASETAYFNTSMLYFCTNAMLAGPALMAVMQAERNFLNYLRENINGWYSPSAYFLARSLLECVLQITATFMFITITWFLTQQFNPTFTFPLAAIILIIHAICCYHMMFIISLFLDSHTNFQLPFLLSTIQCLFGGYMVPPNNLPHVFYYFSRLNFGLYSYIGLMKIVYSPFLGEDVQLSCETSNPILCNRFPNGTSVLRANNIPSGSPVEEILIIVGFTFLYLFLGLPAMISRTNGAKNEIARVTSKDKKANLILVVEKKNCQNNKF